jgi:hypothetical protein
MPGTTQAKPAGDRAILLTHPPPKLPPGSIAHAAEEAGEPQSALPSAKPLTLASSRAGA